jgi:hypothetical protein
MNKFVFSALAGSLVGATGFANDTEWPELDRELAALNSAPLSLDNHEGIHVSGWLISAITSDDTPGDDDSDDLSTGVVASRVNLSGSLGSNYSFMLGWDFTDTGELYAPAGVPVGQFGTGGLTDAYVAVGIADGIEFKMGAFRREFLASSTIQRNHTLFIDRSYLGAQYASRDAGVGLSGNFNRVNWEVTLQNGHSGNGDDFSYSAHVDFDIMGTSSGNEGAIGAAEGTNVNVGLTYADDGSDYTAADVANGVTVDGVPVAAGDSRDAAQLAAYASLTAGAISAAVEIVDQDAAVSVDDAATPWSAGIAYMFGGDYEVGFRWDDYDDALGTNRYNLVLNRYIMGQDLKWQLQFSTGDNDGGPTDPDEADIFALGLAAGF